MTSFEVGETVADRFLITGATRGGMGSVLFCLDTLNMRQVVLKSYLDDPSRCGLRDRFLLEAQSWVRLGRHPNILQALGAFEWRDRFFVAAEYVPPDVGGRTTLADYVRHDEPMGPQVLLSWLGDICSGMRYGQTKGVDCHRDLKPDNLFVSPEGILKIGDWGLVRVVSMDLTRAADGTADGRLTQAGAPLGTPSYMAPECWRDSRAGDERSDIYSLGVIAYELVSGHRPFAGTVAALRAAHQAEAPLPLDSPLWPLIERCLAKHSSERFANFGDLWVALGMEKLHEAVREAQEKDVDAWCFTGRAPAPEDTSDVREVHNQALSLKRLGRTDEALRLYRQVLRMLQAEHDVSPAIWAMVYSNMSSALLGAADPAEADRLADVALSHDPSYASAWTNKAVAQCDMGEYELSRKCHEIALELNPEAVESWNGLACVLVDHLGDYERAIHCCLEALRLTQGNHLPAWVNLGNAYGSLGRFSEAVSAYWDAYEIGGRDALHALCNRTAAALAMDDVELAVSTVREMRRVGLGHPMTREAEGLLARRGITP